MQLRTKQLISGSAAMMLSLSALSVAAQASCANKSSIGVSRTITIDAAGGKLYGGLQYTAGDLLRDGEFILTFDDGPLRRYTRKVLAALKSHCTKASFFMVGRMAVADPAMVREVESAGHTIANHTWSHKNLQRRSARRAGGEIELGISAVRIAAQKPISPFFRFPYLADPKAMIAYGKSRDMAIFSIDIDSNDYKTKSPGRVYSTIMSQVRSRRKGIMLFHDIQRSTAGAMQRILDTMQREGFKIVHVVSKAPVGTIEEFDVQAQALHDKRRTVATAKAIGGGDYEKASRPRRTIRRTVVKSSDRKAIVSKAAAKRSNAFPSRTSAIAQPQIRPQPKADWRKNVWGNN
ncbi:MAG: peptidoglycan/xylan/chitin deacetylase (PgdA/CDA1 family) [Hyphomicrobiaceae bacterium]|jgi:peptidoglycan/xylan/chitin deacetylase (PgdA/CDA1 family)